MWEVKERKTKIMATNLLYENKGIHGGDFFFFNGEQNKNIERQKDGR